MGRTACTEPQCLYKSALYTHILLAALIFLKCLVGKAFATNVIYSVSHLTSIL